MKFGVIYSIDWPADWGEDAPFDTNGLFNQTEDGETEYDVFDNTGGGFHAKFVSRDLLTRKEFDEFIEQTGLKAKDVETMGAIIGGAWGLGWWVPSISFEAYDNESIREAYVTPVPDVPPRSFEHEEEREDYLVRRWEMVRKAVVSVYG